MSEQVPRRSGQTQNQQGESQKGQSQQEEATQKSQQDQSQQAQQGQGKDQGRSNPLQSDRGDTTIQESVVSQVAGIAAQEVEGIRMGGGGSQRAAGLISSVTGGSGGSRTQGVSVEVGKEEAAVDLTLTVEYGRSAPQTADAVRNNVISRIESLLGLRVTEVNVSVTGLFFPDQDQEQSQQQLESGDGSGQRSSRVS